MNGETPGSSSSSSPSDDLDFLGPAISRRRDEEPTPQDTDDLPAGPFAGGRGTEGASDGFGSEGAGLAEAGDEEEFPWLIPAEAGERRADAVLSEDDPWRATGEIEGGGPVGVDREGHVDQGSEPVSLDELGAEVEVARQGWDEAFGEAIAWDTDFGEGEELEADEEAPLDIAALEVASDDAERAGFSVDAEVEEGNWPAPGGPVESESWATDDVVTGEPVAERWEEDEAFSVAGDTAELSAVGADGAGEALEEEDGLGAVAGRLERVARALREGRPLEVAVDGDPLELLLAGYALGYARGRADR